MGRFDTEGQQSAVFLDGGRAGGHGRSESILVGDDVIGGKHEAQGIGIVVEHGPRGVGGTGCGVATGGLGQDVVGGKLVEKLTGGLGGGSGGHDPESLGADQRQDPIGGDPEQGMSDDRARSCFGRSWREAGQKRVPDPPAMMTACSMVAILAGFLSQAAPTPHRGWRSSGSRCRRRLPGGR